MIANTEQSIAIAGTRPAPMQAVRISLQDASNPPIERFVLGKMFPFGKASVFYGPTGVGKSALKAQVLFAFAGGSDRLWGLPIHRDANADEHGGAVLIYTTEDTHEDWARKAHTLLRAGHLDVNRALERLYVIDNTEGIARLSEIVTVREGTTRSRREARPTAEQDLLIQRAREVGARVIFIETASRLVEEEDNASFSALQSALGRIARETGAAVIISHHATKAASKGNDSGIEGARGGGALIANSRNAVSLFPADKKQAAVVGDRFPLEDVVVLGHGKATSSTRRHAPLTLVRCSGIAGAYFMLPDEATVSPEQQAAHEVQIHQDRRRDHELVCKLYVVIEAALRDRRSVSRSWLRDNRAAAIGVAAREVEPLVERAVALGHLRDGHRSNRGKEILLGIDPRTPPAAETPNASAP